MKKTLLLLFFFCSSILQAQNLVPNPSFEDYTVCPNNYGEIDYAVSWHSSTTSCDLYNSCSSSIDVSVPDNSMGNQVALGNSCKGYAGIYTYLGNVNYREYIYAMLDSQLIIGKKYFISMKVSLADESGCGIDKIGILLTTNSLNYGTTIINNCVNYSHVHALFPITDKILWVKISGFFVADSNYNYINIGNFFDINHTDTIGIGNYCLYDNSYYYIDDVCVSSDSSFCYNYSYNCSNGIIGYQKSNIKTYPNPASEKVFIELPSNIDIVNVSIINALGIIVINKIITKNDNQISLLNIPKGYYIITTKSSKINFKKSLIIN